MGFLQHSGRMFFKFLNAMLYNLYMLPFCFQLLADVATQLYRDAESEVATIAYNVSRWTVH